LKKSALLITIAALFLSGCSPERPVKAAYCATVASFHSNDRSDEKKLIALMQPFLRDHGFALQGGEQVDTNEYVNQSQRVMVDVTFGMGKFGSVVTLFSERQPPAGLIGDLDRFLSANVARTFPVMRCSEISGFATPTISDSLF
jgi:hypothetical protein